MTEEMYSECTVAAQMLNLFLPIVLPYSVSCAFCFLQLTLAKVVERNAPTNLQKWQFLSHKLEMEKTCWNLQFFLLLGQMPLCCSLQAHVSQFPLERGTEGSSYLFGTLLKISDFSTYFMSAQLAFKS